MNALKQYWRAYQRLRLPWRRKFFVGEDLEGNTYWEFKDQIAAGRMRRIRKQTRGAHVADVSVSPQWHQWLRHTRDEPPSMREQQYDVQRQVQLKHNAALADARWAAKARYIEKPKEVPRMTFGGNPEVGEGQQTIHGGDAPKTEPDHKEGVRNAVQSPPGAPKEDPWEQERLRQENEKRAAPAQGGQWQPETWMPGTLKRK